MHSCYRLKFLAPHNITTRKTRQGNLSSILRTEDKERTELLERKRALKAELMTTSTAIGHIEHDMDRLQTYIINSGTVYPVLNEQCIKRHAIFYEIFKRWQKSTLCLGLINCHTRIRTPTGIPSLMATLYDAEHVPIA